MAKLKRTVLVSGLSGSSGPVTFKITREGTIVSERSTPANPNTAGQLAARDRFRAATTAFRGLTSNQEKAWEAYADTFSDRDDITGKSRRPNAINLFVRYATKFLQVTPGGTIPLAPPTTGFAGDKLLLDVESDPGQLTITANAANTAGTTTEILIQRLASPNRNPQPGAYRHAAFKVFTSGSLSVVIPVTPGHYSVAARYVSVATGQDTGLRQIAVTTVSLGLAKSAPKGGKKAA